MKLKRKWINVRHAVKFSRPNAGLVVQSPRIVEAILEQLAVDYRIGSRDVQVQSGLHLGDWSIRLSLFRGQGSISISVDGIETSYTSLLSDADLSVVTVLQSKLMEILASQAPTLQGSAESISGQVAYEVHGGERERNAYFSRVNFPGKAGKQDCGFRFRVRDGNQEAIALFTVEPVWAVSDQILISFDVDTSTLTSQKFEARAETANKLVLEAYQSLELEIAEEPSS